MAGGARVRVKCNDWMYRIAAVNGVFGPGEISLTSMRGLDELVPKHRLL